MGCGALLAFGGAAAAAVYFLVVRPVQSAIDAAPDIASALPSGFGIPPLPPPAGPDVVADPGVGGSAGSPGVARGAPTGSGGAPGGTRAPSGAGGTASGGAATAAGGSAGSGGSGGAVSGASCALAARCCRLIVSRSPGSNPGLVGNCDGIKLLSEAMCQQQLQTYRQAAQLLGVTCS